MIKLSIAMLATAWLVGMGAETAQAQMAFHSPGGFHSFLTSRGSAVVTGQVGSMETTTLPGRAGEGFLMDNGNGTSTLLSPGGTPQTVATPR